MNAIAFAQVAHHAQLLKEVEATEATLRKDAAELAAERAQLADRQQAAAAEAARLAAQAEQLSAERSALEARARAVANSEAQAQVSHSDPHSSCAFLRFPKTALASIESTGVLTTRNDSQPCQSRMQQQCLPSDGPDDAVPA